ncbi:MAG TPA: tetratricopeptide repeat protein [Longimicrobiaceae bacterium]|nr:tetratricopeptide repeat protein [Longimicrobiaceae bacterium]
MARRRKPAPPRKTDRRWHIPPPLVHGPEPLEGGSVLEELQGPLAVVLWQAMRDVRLWTEAAPEERAALFAAGAGAGWGRAARTLAPEPSMRTALKVLAGVSASPTEVEEPALAKASREIAEWAEEHGAPRTALAYQQNAALSAPADPEAALAAARLAVRAGDDARAEVWFRRTVGLARQAREWRLYAQAFRGLGTLYRSRGNLPGAHRFFIRALRGARRGGLRLEQAAALHELFALSAQAGRAAEADRYGRMALESYGPRAPEFETLTAEMEAFRAR